MALQSSGKIKFSEINTELGVTSTTRRSLSEATTRTLFGVASGRIRLSDGYGKANRVALSYVFSSNTTQTTITASSLPGYIAGKTDLTITVNSGIYLYSTSTGTAALTVSGASSGDTIALVNNGYIMGMGGDGAQSIGAGSAGGPAISLSYGITLTNNSYIGGGGGGGATRGGGGAGGGKGGGGGTGATSNGGAGGGPGSAGSDGPLQSGSASGAGGGGRIMPGSGGAGVVVSSSWNTPARGGGAGGGGGGYKGASNPQGSGGTGGSAGNAGATGVGPADVAQFGTGPGGGGGGWGAAGGNKTGNGANSGGAGGKAIALNGYTVTYVANGTIYGAVS